jgi:enterochelin esterase-like enzyme
VFAGDGQGITRWVRTLEAATMPPTMVIGVHSAADEGVRLHEYSPGFDPQRFAGHERLFVARVREWARGRFGVALPPSRTAVHGVSAGGELAIALGLRHPDVYAVILSASPGAGYRPPDELPRPLPRAYLVAGTLEPFFLANAVRWVDALRAAGAEVVLRERAAGHDEGMWRTELPLMIDWAFGATRG